jgi:hypothetical protein
VLSRSQALTLGFFVVAWASLLVILAISPEIYDQALRLAPGDDCIARLAFVVGLTVFVALLCFGVVRRWRWAFWLILVAFLAGALRVPASILELAGTLPAQGPRLGCVCSCLTGDRGRCQNAVEERPRSKADY